MGEDCRVAASAIGAASHSAASLVYACSSRHARRRPSSLVYAVRLVSHAVVPVTAAQAFAGVEAVLVCSKSAAPGAQVTADAVAARETAATRRNGAWRRAFWDRRGAASAGRKVASVVAAVSAALENAVGASHSSVEGAATDLGCIG